MKHKCSILCPSYNHENFVSDFIMSVLNQTVQDFELIIVDDCSTDATGAIIATFQDRRIKFYKNEINRGINASLNRAFENSGGEYIVLCASDDLLEANALEDIITCHEKNNIDIVYSNMLPIDEYNNVRFDIKLKQLRNYRKETYLHQLFFVENILYSPGMSVRRDLLRKVFPLPNSNIIYQDYKLHIDLLRNGSMYITEKKNVRYRIARYRKSLSAPGRATQVRLEAEISSLMDSFLLIQDISLLKRIFSREIGITGIEPYPETIKFFLGRMALLAKQTTRKLWGYHQIMHAYNEDVSGEILYKRYGFVFKDLLNLTEYF